MWAMLPGSSYSWLIELPFTSNVMGLLQDISRKRASSVCEKRGPMNSWEYDQNDVEWVTILALNEKSLDVLWPHNLFDKFRICRVSWWCKRSVYTHLDLMQREIILPLVEKSISHLICFIHMSFAFLMSLIFALPLMGTIVNLTKDRS